MLPVPCLIDLFTILEIYWSDDPTARVSLFSTPPSANYFRTECGRRTRLNHWR